MLDINNKKENLTDLDEFIKNKIDEYPDATPLDRAVAHFVVGGTVFSKQVPWVDSENGQVIDKEPEWYNPSMDPEIRLANFIARLPNKTENNSDKIKVVKNPLTNQISEKEVPWLDENGTIILSEYIPGIEFKAGKKNTYSHNPDQEFDDPSDLENSRFFRDTRIMYCIVNGLFTERHIREKTKLDTLRIGVLDYDIEKEQKAILGINFGGTIMMDSNLEGLSVGNKTISGMYKDNLQKKYPNCLLKSFSFAKTKINRDSEISNYGIDSSTQEIDFLGDTVLIMVHIWNSLSSEEKKDFPGFLITHGSDSIVEATTYIKMMLGPNCPFSVVVVASMKPAEAKSSEGIANMSKAVEHLINLNEEGLAIIGMRLEGGVYDPTKTKKIRDDQATSFKGDKLIDTEKFETATDVEKTKSYRMHPDDYEKDFNKAIVMRGSNQVKLLSSKLSDDVFEIEREVALSNAKAFIVETYASFTQDTKIADAILRGAGSRPVFYINPVDGGSTDHEYQITKSIKEKGILPLSMNTISARVKLNYAMQFLGKENKQMVIDFMTKNNFVGEQNDSFKPYTDKLIGAINNLKKNLYKNRIDSNLLEKFQFNMDLTTLSNEEATMYLFYSTIERLSIDDFISIINTNQQIELKNTMVNCDNQNCITVLEESQSTVAMKGNPIPTCFN